MKAKKTAKAKTFDADFDGGADITESLDIAKARRPNQELKNVLMSIFQLG